MYATADFICVFASVDTHKHTQTQKEGICFKAQVVRQQNWATRSHKYQRLECVSMKTILHPTPDCPCESLLACSVPYILCKDMRATLKHHQNTSCEI